MSPMARSRRSALSALTLPALPEIRIERARETRFASSFTAFAAATTFCSSCSTIPCASLVLWAGRISSTRSKNSVGRLRAKPDVVNLGECNRPKSVVTALTRARYARLPSPWTGRGICLSGQPHAVYGAKWLGLGSLSPLPKPRRKIRPENHLRMHPARARQQRIFIFGIVRVRNTAIDRTRRRTFLVVEEAHTLGALLRHDVIDILGERRMCFAVEFP